MAIFKKFTRSEFNYPIFGHPIELSVNKLPTYEEVPKRYFYENYKISLEIKQQASFLMFQIVSHNKFNLCLIKL